MAALQRVSILQHNPSARYSISTLENSRSFSSSSQAFGSVAPIAGNISLPSLSTRSRIPGRFRLWVANAGGEGGADSTQEKVDDNSATTSVASPGERKLGGGAKGFGAPPKAAATEKKNSSKPSSLSSGSIRRAPPSKPLIGVPAADQQAQQIETAVVGSLAFLFAVILLEGLLLAASGFLPEDWDQFAVNSVYPAFTPSVGVFLTIAACYGLWKYLGGGPGASSR